MKAKSTTYTVRKGQLTIARKEHTMFARIITLVILCAAITSCGSQNSPVASYTAPGSAVVPAAEKSTVDLSQNIADQLNLTDQQRQELKDLQTQYKADLASVNQTTAAGDIADLSEEFESSFFAILDAEQQVEYQTVKAESHDIAAKLRDTDI